MCLKQITIEFLNNFLFLPTTFWNVIDTPCSVMLCNEHVVISKSRVNYNGVRNGFWEFSGVDWLLNVRIPDGTLTETTHPRNVPVLGALSIGNCFRVGRGD